MGKHARTGLGLSVALGTALLGGCHGKAKPVDGGDADCTELPCACALHIPMSVRDGVDLLFVLDDSPSMAALQGTLKQRMRGVLQGFSELAQIGCYADLHVGVITGDYGANGAPGCGATSEPFGGGLRGKLQALGRAADPGCLPPRDANYLHYRFGPSGAAVDNLPPGQDLETTLGCMAAVGTGGCTYQMPLEATYAALHSGLPENAGFLRDDAMLVAVFVTNQDDASAPPESELYATSRRDRYGPETVYARATRHGVVCGAGDGPPPNAATKQPLSDCRPAPNPSQRDPDRLYDVSRYVHYLTAPRAQGGVKVNPLDVVLIGDIGPTGPFSVRLSHPDAPGDAPLPDCAPLDEDASPPCVPVLAHSCAHVEPSYYGDPAVRLDAVIGAAHFHESISVCDDDEVLAKVIGRAAQPVISDGFGGCFPCELPRDPVAMTPRIDCTAEDETIHADGTVTYTSLPECDASGIVPCWKLEPADECDVVSPGGLRFSVERGATNGVPDHAPPHTTTVLSCPDAARPPSEW